jgi:ubiquinone/menaquinone biosynthesis C-methylase UbiE
MQKEPRSFTPAAGHDWLLAFYDPLQRWLGAAAIVQELIEQANVQAGQRVLDIGCGTGSLAIALKQQHPGIEAVGLDPDPRALAIARRKAGDAAVEIELERGFADAIPSPDDAFDRVFSSFMFHHLSRQQKTTMLSEALRVLKPEASLHLVDFGRSKAGTGGWVERLLHRSSDVRDNMHIESFMKGAGFTRVQEISQRSTLFGTVCYHRAS